MPLSLTRFLIAARSNCFLVFPQNVEAVISLYIKKTPHVPTRIHIKACHFPALTLPVLLLQCLGACIMCEESTSAVGVREKSAYNSAGLLIAVSLIIAVQNNSSPRRTICAQAFLCQLRCLPFNGLLCGADVFPR